MDQSNTLIITVGSFGERLNLQLQDKFEQNDFKIVNFDSSISQDDLKSLIGQGDRVVLISASSKYLSDITQLLHEQITNKSKSIKAFLITPFCFEQEDIKKRFNLANIAISAFCEDIEVIDSQTVIERLGPGYSLLNSFKQMDEEVCSLVVDYCVNKTEESVAC